MANEGHASVVLLLTQFKVSTVNAVDEKHQKMEK